MTKRNWKHYRPSSLQEAFKACVDFAQERHQMSVDRIADAMGLPGPWSLYKWVAAATMPVRLIRPFESACRCTFVTQHLGASAHKLMIDMPIGRKATPVDINAVQAACNEAVNALIRFADGQRDQISTVLTLGKVTEAIECLARERAEVQGFTQPELKLS